jgi:hypothetical protein
LGMYAEAHAATIVRMLIGTTREGYTAVEKRVLSSSFGKNYVSHLDHDGQQALSRVKAHMSKIKIMTDIRNGFSFHNPSDDQIDTAYKRLPIDAELSMYSGLPRHSSLYAMSNNLVTQAMIDVVHEPTAIQSMQTIVDDALEKATALNDLIEQLLKAIMDRETLSIVPHREVLTVDTHQSTLTFSIPPLLRT